MRLRFLGLCLALLPLSLFGQNVRDAMTIEVVDVPVFVTRGGQAVKGLTSDDFELFVNGKPHPIDYFDVVNAGSPAGEPQTLRERRLFVLVIDLAFSHPPSVLRAQRAAAELVEKAPATDLFAIATFSARRGIWFATPFTSDRVALARGIASLNTSRSGDPLAIVLSPGERLDVTRRLSDPAMRSEVSYGDRVLGGMAEDALRDLWLMEFRHGVQNQVDNLRELASRLSMLQGQKHVVVLSDGYEMGSTGGSRRPRPDAAGFPRMDTPVTFIGGSLFRHLDDMRKTFQASDVLLHTLDLRGVDTLRDTSSLFVFANETGGKFVHNRNDFGPQLVALSKSYSYGYVIGFRPGKVKAGNNSIEVRMKARPRDVVVSHRKGFNGAPLRVDVGEGLYLADVVLNDVPQTGTAPDLSLDGRTLHVRVPLRPLAVQLGKAGQAELLVYAFGKDGTALGFHRRAIDVPAQASGEAALAFVMPEHAQVAKALLRVDDSLGFSRTF